MRITYASKKVEKYFQNYEKMQQKLPFEWVRTIKKHMNHLTAAECFGDFLKLGLGKPHPLHGNNEGRYGIHITPNVRLVVEPNEKQDAVMICKEIEVEGVCDYHGEKENWYIP